MSEYRTLVAWRENDDLVDEIHDELLNRIDFCLPKGSSDVGDEMRRALSVALTLRKYPHTTLLHDRGGSDMTQRMLLGMVLHMIAMVEELNQRWIDFDAWVTEQEAEANA